MVVDELDQFDPVKGAMTPSQLDGYVAANHLWTAKSRQIRLFAARSEIIGFQVAFKGAIKDVMPSLSFPTANKVVASFGRYAHVRAGTDARPDPIVPLDGGFTVPTPEDAIDGQQVGSLHVELFVPGDTPAGDHKGTLTLRAGDDTLELPVVLRVWDFTLPDRLSFLPEMNMLRFACRRARLLSLAHRHRTVLNVVPYSQRGEVDPGLGAGLERRADRHVALGSPLRPVFRRDRI